MGNPIDHRKKSLHIRVSFIICLCLVLTTALVYLHVLHHEFTLFDDDGYVTENPHVRSGLNFSGLVWAFSFSDMVYWHPLTWLSHMLDVQLYGLNPGMHHATNLILHILNSLALFFFWHQTTGAKWKSAFVAALFALHPINVESVAWVSERKNLLSTFFWILTMISYGAYARNRGLMRYLAVFFCMALGLMAKPTLVTLPFVLLLLDYWPLGRFRLSPEARLAEKKETNGYDWRCSRPLFHLVFEKLPFFVLSAVSVYIGIYSVQRLGLAISTQTTPFETRIANALVSYVRYIGKMIWPRDLIVFYPFPERIALWKTLVCLLTLIGLSVWLLRSYRKIPALGIGWLWFIGTLVPTIGFFQAGLWPALADRWAYIPFIGLYVIVAWGIPEAIRHLPLKPAIITVTTLTFLSFLSVTSWVQVQYWKDSISLFMHAVRTNDNNVLGHYNLAVAMERKGFITDAMAHHRRTLALSPNHYEAHNSLGFLLAEQGKINAAIQEYSVALRIHPGFADAHNNLGAALLRQGKTAEAMKQFSEAIRLNPGHSDALNNIGIMLISQMEIESAVDHFKLALQHRPDDRKIRNNLNRLMSADGIVDSAIDSFQNALIENPESEELYFRLGNLFRIRGKFKKAVSAYLKAIEIGPEREQAFTGLSLAYAMDGEYEKAIDILEKTIARWPEQPFAYYYAACVYSRQQKAAEAIQWLRLAVQKGFKDWQRIQSDENLAAVRNTAAFQQLIKGR